VLARIMNGALAVMAWTRDGVLKSLSTLDDLVKLLSSRWRNVRSMDQPLVQLEPQALIQIVAL
jgi:hypothetical protein